MCLCFRVLCFIVKIAAASPSIIGFHNNFIIKRSQFSSHFWCRLFRIQLSTPSFSTTRHEKTRHNYTPITVDKGHGWGIVVAL